MLAFVMFWAYVSFSQYLIIWAGNLPGGDPLVPAAAPRRLGLVRHRDRPLPLRCCRSCSCCRRRPTATRGSSSASRLSSSSCASSTSSGSSGRATFARAAVRDPLAGPRGARSASSASGSSSSSGSSSGGRSSPSTIPNSRRRSSMARPLTARRGRRPTVEAGHETERRLDPRRRPVRFWARRRTLVVVALVMLGRLPAPAAQDAQSEDRPLPPTSSQRASQRTPPEPRLEDRAARAAGAAARRRGRAPDELRLGRPEGGHRARSRSTARWSCIASRGFAATATAPAGSPGAGRGGAREAAAARRLAMRRAPPDGRSRAR